MVYKYVIFIVVLVCVIIMFSVGDFENIKGE